ncbi:MAG: hypothetical protein HWN68_20490 [Desulfobacterales bacterium]|nr:hypothetical protein [Desulfobacterales bacterium]
MTSYFKTKSLDVIDHGKDYYQDKDRSIIVTGAEAILRVEFEPSLNELTVKEAIFNG